MLIARQQDRFNNQPHSRVFDRFKGISIFTDESLALFKEHSVHLTLLFELHALHLALIVYSAIRMNSPFPLIQRASSGLLCASVA